MFAWALSGATGGRADEAADGSSRGKSKRASVSFSTELALAPADSPIREPSRRSVVHGPNLEVLARQLEPGSEPSVKRLRALALDHTLIIPAIELEQHDIVGEGTYGIVWRCKYYARPGMPAHSVVRDANDLVALKHRKPILRVDGGAAAARSADEADLAQWMRELLLLRSLAHPNVIGYVGCTVSKGEDGQDELALVQEFAPHGTLHPLIHAPAGLARPFTVAEGVQWAQEVASGLAYLHSCSPPIVHRTLKPENILLCGPRVSAKIADFHLSAFEPASRRASDAGTLPGGGGGSRPAAAQQLRHYAAPELLRGEPATHRADIYAFGVLLYELLVRRPAHTGPPQRAEELARAAASNDLRPSLPTRWPAAAKALVQRAWDADPSARIEFELIEHELTRWMEEEAHFTIETITRGSPRTALEHLGLHKCAGRTFVERVMQESASDHYAE